MTDPVDPRALSKLRKRRGVAKGSITRLETRLKVLEGAADQPNTQDSARQMLAKLEEHNAGFMDAHLSLIDLIDDDDEDGLETEQLFLDEHEDFVASLTIRIQTLITSIAPSTTKVSERKVLSRRLKRLEDRLTVANESVTALTAETADICRLKQHNEQLVDYKETLADVSINLSSLDLEETDELLAQQTRLEELVFNCSLRVKELVQALIPTPPASPATRSSAGEGLKLPKLDVPVFDGNILHWRNFWEQFSVSVHNRPSLSNAEKLVYLQQSLKNGSAKNVIEGLSRSGDNYEEAIQCLKTRYDRPRLIHQGHVKTILEATPLKDGTGKELRKLHDTVQQHLRALKSMGHDPSGPFITSTLELKLDQNTMFEWQKHSQSSSDVPQYQDLLDFLNLRAQATESSLIEHGNKKLKHETSQFKGHSKHVTSYMAHTAVQTNQCVLCKPDKHPLYACPRFKDMNHDTKVSTLKTNNLCMNCLGTNHFVKQCKSIHRCKQCQKPHHTLLHIEGAKNISSTHVTISPQENSNDIISSHTAMELKSNSLLMTCRVLVIAPNGTSVEARALLDNASSASFITERLSQSLCLPRAKQNARISGIAGLSHSSPTQSLATFSIAPVSPSTKKIGVTAVVVPSITCDLPFHPIPFKTEWSHLSHLQLADPGFGRPGRIDVLLGVDVFVDVLLHGRRNGPPGTPVALETHFGWVLAGSTDTHVSTDQVTTLHASCVTGDDLLRKFWETEDNPLSEASLTPEERSAMQHFKTNHRRTEDGRFVVPLPKRDNVKQLGESRSQTVRRFLSLERTLRARNQFVEFGKVINEYFDLGHAELVPSEDLSKPSHEVFYLPMHAVRKESSTTTKIRAVFDASMKTTSGISLNDSLMVGPTIHPPLVDVLLRFRLHRIAIVADVSKMYRAIELPSSDRDLHRFVWRNHPDDTLLDYRMTRVTFGVSSSSFIANMTVKQNSIDFAHKYPLATKVVDESFYVDDCLTGANSVEEGIKLRGQLQNLFAEADLLLRKWNSSNPGILQAIPPELRDTQTSLTISDIEEVYTKTLGIEWHSVLDHFRLSVANHSPLAALTKRTLVSDIAKTYDVLGWFAPAIVKVKILLQRIWESKIDWDDDVPPMIAEQWLLWRSQLNSLSQKHIPRCYFPKEVQIVSTQLHGFSDASESAYAGVVYLRMMDSDGQVHVSLVAAKSKVAPIKRLTIPRLELCGAHLLSKLLEHVRSTIGIPVEDLYAWTDSTIVVNWLDGNPRRFKTYVGNRISFILDRIPPNRWRHVPGEQNPADCASRGLLPLELLEYDLWWDGPIWLKLSSSNWPGQTETPPNNSSDEEREICLLTNVVPKDPLIPVNRFSSFTKLIRVTAWVLRFTRHCRIRKDSSNVISPLTVQETVCAANYWLSHSQKDSFTPEIAALTSNTPLTSNSNLLCLHPFLDSNGILRVKGREQNSKLAYSTMHPVILHGKQPITKLIIQEEHVRLLHAGPTLLTSSLNRRFHIVGGRRFVRSITRGCTTCRRNSEKPQPQLMGQLPMERVTPDLVFENVGIDYAGPVYIKYGYVRKPKIVKAYVCIFVSLTVKAVHLELVSDLTTDAFISALRRFIARRGKPKLLWSDHGTNFVGAQKELNELAEFLESQRVQNVVSQFCTSQRVQWKFIPERSPHFGGLWESAVKSMKYHLKRVTTNVKLTFEEFSTVITQIEACLNSRPIVALSCNDDEIEALTPGHFLIGRPIEALPDSSFSYRTISLLRRWHLCQTLTRQFWQRWSQEYLASLRKYAKWHKPMRNLSVGDVVVLHESGLVQTKWPLGRVIKVYNGKDGLVRVADIKTQTGVFKRPIHKLALLLPSEN